MAKRVSALSQVLKETQAAQLEPQSDITVIPQNSIPVLPQSSITEKPEYGTTGKLQRLRKTDLRDKVTYYLEPGQRDKLDEMRVAYKKATGRRLSEQDFMRLIVDRLELHTLL